MSKTRLTTKPNSSVNTQPNASNAADAYLTPTIRDVDASSVPTDDVTPADAKDDSYVGDVDGSVDDMDTADAGRPTLIGDTESTASR